MVEEMRAEFERLSRAVFRMIRVGVVVTVYPDKGTVRVRFPDQDDEVSYELPVVVRKAYKDKDYWLPDVEEQVLCVFLPFAPEQGFVVGSFYSKADSVPTQNSKVKRVEFEDGTIVEYDKFRRKLLIKTNGSVEVEAREATVKSERAEVRAQRATVVGLTRVEITSPEIEVIGMLRVSGAVLAGSVTSQGPLQAPGLSANAGEVILDGNLLINGDLTVNGTVSCVSCNQAP